MKPGLDIVVDRQILHPGEEVRGRVVLAEGLQARSLTVSLQGEEVLGAHNISGLFVLPLVEESKQLTPEDLEFSFRIPPDAPPSYASIDLRCQYFLKVRLSTGGLREGIRKLHLTVLPRETPGEGAGPLDLALEHGGVKLEVRLDNPVLAWGESLFGSLILNRLEEEAELPTLLTFRFACVEESTDPAFRHRRALWVQSHEVPVSEELDFPIVGTFEFPLDIETGGPWSASESPLRVLSQLVTGQTGSSTIALPFTGTWPSFRVFFGFRMGMRLAGGGDVRQSVNLHVYRRYLPEKARPRGLPLTQV
ncbi:MAG TPA: hypothetical protein VNO81_13760 [Candidatus Nitrosotenuis sp.]|jgi:hypothetical protein|nr:hypothetical protein [Candidatus Nitrosotenuis sp.]